MFALEQVTPTTSAEITAIATKLQQQGYRFVIINCVDLGDKFDLLYQFDKELSLTTYRVTVDKKQVVPSISPVFISALLIENELQDLFGMKFSDLVIDYHQLLMTVEDITAPQCVSNLNVQFAKKKTATEIRGGKNE